MSETGVCDRIGRKGLDFFFRIEYDGEDFQETWCLFRWTEKGRNG